VGHGSHYNSARSLPATVCTFEFTHFRKTQPVHTAFGRLKKTQLTLSWLNINSPKVKMILTLDLVFKPRHTLGIKPTIHVQNLAGNPAA
jgi:hypothetical protein